MLYIFTTILLLSLNLHYYHHVEALNHKNIDNYNIDKIQLFDPLCYDKRLDNICVFYFRVDINMTITNVIYKNIDQFMYNSFKQTEYFFKDQYENIFLTMRCDYHTDINYDKNYFIISYLMNNARQPDTTFYLTDLLTFYKNNITCNNNIKYGNELSKQYYNFTDSLWTIPYYWPKLLPYININLCNTTECGLYFDHLNMYNFCTRDTIDNCELLLYEYCKDPDTLICETSITEFKIIKLTYHSFIQQKDYHINGEYSLKQNHHDTTIQTIPIINIYPTDNTNNIIFFLQSKNMINAYITDYQSYCLYNIFDPSYIYNISKNNITLTVELFTCDEVTSSLPDKMGFGTSDIILNQNDCHIPVYTSTTIYQKDDIFDNNIFLYNFILSSDTLYKVIIHINSDIMVQKLNIVPLIYSYDSININR